MINDYFNFLTFLTVPFQLLAPQLVNEEVESEDDGDVSAIPKHVSKHSIIDDFVPFDNEDTLQFKRDVQGQSLVSVFRIF